MKFITYFFAKRGVRIYSQNTFLLFFIFATLYHDKVFASKPRFSVLQQVKPSKNGSKKSFLATLFVPKTTRYSDYFSLNLYILRLFRFLQQNYRLNVGRDDILNVETTRKHITPRSTREYIFNNSAQLYPKIYINASKWLEPY